MRGPVVRQALSKLFGAVKARGRDGWVGVLDACTLDEAALRARRPVAAGWLGDRALTLQRSA
jgi:hypothetical protein